MRHLWDAIIIGAGAAGLYCAATACARDKNVLILEANDRAGKKILISGGGRCNFTNLNTRPENFLSENPHFCRSALAQLRPQVILDLVKSAGIEYCEKGPGQLFCEKSSKDMLRALLEQVKHPGVQLKTSAKVCEISKKQDHFEVCTHDEVFLTRSVVIATGGLSYPKLGANDFGYRIAKQFGLNVIPTRPALTPLLFAEADQKRFQNLAGVAVPVTIRFKRQSFDESLLFTHDGMSGPAVLQISSYWTSGEIRIDFLPNIKLEDHLLQAKRNEERRLPKNLLARWLPDRLADEFCSTIPNRPLLEISDSTLRKLAQDIKAFKFTPKKLAGYERAEVTVGGVDTRELSSQTMMSTRVPGLYFIGEVVDVTGWLGGFNFQWAWASGFAAGNSI